MPEEECPLCHDVNEALDRFIEVFGGTTSLQQHALASMMAWWVAASLKTTEGNAAPLAMCFANALKDAGVDAKVQTGVIAVPLSSSAHTRN
jgi:hypothetical protein